MLHHLQKCRLQLTALLYQRLLCSIFFLIRLGCKSPCAQLRRSSFNRCRTDKDSRPSPLNSPSAHPPPVSRSKMTTSPAPKSPPKHQQTHSLPVPRAPTSPPHLPSRSPAPVPQLPTPRLLCVLGHRFLSTTTVLRYGALCLLCLRGMT
jgi:hypothetical protein